MENCEAKSDDDCSVCLGQIKAYLDHFIALVQSKRWENTLMNLMKVDFIVVGSQHLGIFLACECIYLGKKNR